MATNLRFRIIAAAIAAATLAAAFLILNHPESGAPEQSTDDAYVQADFTVIVPQVAGVITDVAVSDHQEVRAGDPLVGIDERDFRIAADSAAARVAGARAAIESLRAQLARQQSAIEQASAAVAAARANLELAEANKNRFANLARDGSGTVLAQQQAEAQWDVQRAAHERDQAGLQSARQQVAILQADLEKAQAALLAARAEKAAADLNLSRASVTAPVSGVVAQRRARVGGYARVGEPLLTLVPLDAVYVEANFRETQLSRVRAGQPVEMTVDALPGVRLKGRVESLGPASGVSFSPVPPHNATGNFTKIVQRLPVRIRLEPGQENARRLRVGMSVRPSIDVGEPPPAAPKPGHGAAA
ncbi:MAG: HlyD family secretion protein [Candidatus Accumulibacter sp.]|jgi:membrane fusion protein (multidrug efflux system)|nr:HlyD family secretion protein [Accumulibacter sp.]